MSQNGPNFPTIAGDRHLLLQADRFSVERIGWIDRGGTHRWKDVVRHPGAVVILPILDDGRICLIRNHRVTVGESLLEVPAGTLDPNEIPLDCAKRELEEETGYRAGKLQGLGWFYVSPGILDERMHLFVASDLSFNRPNRMPDEEIENFPISYDDALQLVLSGEIHDAKTIVALLRYPHVNAEPPEINA